MHDSASESPVGARAHTQEQIGLLRSGIPICVYHYNFCASFTLRFERMCHDIDLGARCVGAPDNDQIGSSHLTWISAGQTTGAGNKAIPSQRHADGGMLA